MGKTIAEESPTNMTKISPTVEQMRLARMLSNNDRSCDLAAMEKSCQELVRLFGCSEITALARLRDYDTFQEAAESFFDQKLSDDAEWQTKGKRSKKSHNNQARGDAENLSVSHPHEISGSATIVCNGDEKNHESAPGDYQHQHQRLNNGFSATGAAGFRKRLPPDGSRDTTRPPRGRGRGGFSTRGGQSCGREGFESIEHQNGGDMTENFNERTTEGRGGFRGRRGSQNTYRGNGRGSYKGFGQRRHNENDSSFQNEGNTWTNETESNTWDNSMAGKWCGPKSSTNGDHHNKEAPPLQDNEVVVDEWKNTTGGGGNKNSGNFNCAENNTWDNSMAQSVVQQNNQYRRKDTATSDNYRNRDSFGRQPYSKHGMGTRNAGNRCNNVHKDEWNSDDWTGEDVDWKKMNRVYVNQQQNSQTSKLNQSSQSNTSSIPSSSSQQPQQHQLSAASQSNTNATQSPRGGNAFTSSAPQTHDAQKHAAAANLNNTGIGSHIRGESIDVKLLFSQKSSEAENESAGGQWNKQAADAIKHELGVGGIHVYCECVLFKDVQVKVKIKVCDGGVPQIEIFFKIGNPIGRTVAPNADQMQRGQRPFPSSRPTTSKVEMPSSVTMVGKIDVEFGEFTSPSLKLRPNVDEQATSYYEFGTATSFMSADMVKRNETNTLNACSQTTNSSLYQRTPSKDQQVPVELSLNSSVQSSLSKDNASAMNNQKNALKQATAVVNDIAAPVDLLYGGAGAVPSSNAFMRTAASSAVSTATATEQYHQAQTQTGAVAHQQQSTQQSAVATSTLNNNRSPSMLQNKSQQTLGLTGQQTAHQHGQPQRSYMSSGVQSSTDNTKEATVNPSTITLPSTQAGMNYNNSVNRTVTTSAAGKPQISSAAIFNPATNPSYQALAAAMPYIYPPAEQNYLNALQFLQGPTAGYPFSALGTLPFDIASLTLRDTQQSISNDGKQFSANRTDLSMSGASAANTSINAPPGLGPATVQNAEQQAAQLLTPAAAAAAAYTHPYQLMQAAPFYAPFVVPNVTNSSASTVNTVNQFNKNFASAQPMYYGSGDMQMAQDYTKSLYGVNISGQPPSQNKQGSTGTNLSINANDTASKGYSNTLKMFDGKNFQQNTATPPPGIGNVNFPPGAAAAFHSSNVNAAAAAAAAAAYGPYAQFLPHQISMLPPNIAAQAQTVNPNDVLNNAGQRGTTGGNKAGPNVYSAAKNNAYWAN